MDAYEATKIVFQRIQSLDPQNAAKIMGLLLIQDHGEKDMIRLALGPESLFHSVILKAKKDLNLTQQNMPSSPLSPFSNPSPSSPLSRQNSCPSSAPVRLNLPSWSDDLISPTGSAMNSAAAPFYGNGEIDLIDELQLQDQLSFLNDGGKISDFFYQDLALNPNGNPPSYPWAVNGHRRSYSVSDIYMGSDDVSSGFGWKPCLFYARGYCKNGTSCRFLHGEGATAADGGAPVVGSPSKFEILEQQSQELLRSKPAQQLMASANFPYSPKCVNLLDGSRALMMGDGIMHKFGRTRIDFSNPGSRQIYLTFPADSTFKEEDVSNYFSNFGPVQDVRIPYQQKRMFGFVTFEFPETVKLILAKGNPHFVCDARVLVKPYKEKGKIPDKHRKQQIERGEFSPTGMESRDPYDIQLGSRMFYGGHDVLWRRKLEEADLHQSIELQNRRLMGLQLLDVKRNSLSNNTVISSPTYSPTSFFNLNIMSSNQSSPDGREELGSIGTVANPGYIEPEKDKIGKESESSDHNLPDSPFASPESTTVFSNANLEETMEKDSTISNVSSNNNLITGSSLFPTASPFKSCNFHLPRFASGRETIGM